MLASEVTCNVLKERELVQYYFGFEVAYHARNKGLLWVRYHDGENVKQLYEIYRIYRRNAVGISKSQDVCMKDFSEESLRMLAEVACSLINDPLFFEFGRPAHTIGFLEGVRAGYLEKRRVAAASHTRAREACPVSGARLQ